MLILYLTVLAAALYLVLKMLLPEMAKPPLPSRPSKSSKPSSSDHLEPNGAGIGFEKLEMLLVEKNESIQFLQTELKVSQVQIRDFEKIKMLLQDEIHRLREQNRIFRSELGLPTIQIKENSIT